MKTITEQVEDLIDTYGKNTTCQIDLETNEVAVKCNLPRENPLFLASDYLAGIECILKPIAEFTYQDSDSRKIFLYIQNDHFGCIASNGTVFGSIFEETAAGAIAEFKRLYAQPQQFNFSVNIL